MPQLKYTIITSSTLMLVGSLTYFDLIFVLTQGGPGDATRILPLDMYLTGFQANQMGAASVIGVILVVFGPGTALRHAKRLGAADRSQPDGRNVMTTSYADPARRAPAAARRVGPGAAPTTWAACSAGSGWRSSSCRSTTSSITSLQDQGDYFTSNPLSLPIRPTLTAYQQVLENGFARYFVNSLIVTVGTVHPGHRCSLAGLLRDRPRHQPVPQLSHKLFLLGLAIPLQATIIPIYLIITEIHMYDTLLALILPSIAFAIPLTVLILTNFLRDIPKELFESMRMDGCTEWQMAWRLRCR